MVLQPLNNIIMRNDIALTDLLPLVVGITKKEIASQLDKGNPLFNFSVETGLTSYHNYTRNELLKTCIQFGIDPVSNYHKQRSTKEWIEAYSKLINCEL